MTLCYVPAGCEAYSQSTIQVNVRNLPNKRERTHFGQKYKKWETLDRTVVEIATSPKGAVLPTEEFDTAVSIFSPTFLKNLGLKVLLANPVVGKSYVKAPFHSAGLRSIVDSGGFQMLTGVSDFVHPDEVIARYNANADIGMPLDLPVRSKFEDQYFNSVSHLIKANDQYILKRLNKNIDLALISHGSSLELRKRRLDVLDRDARVVAIAGLGIKPPPGIDRHFAAVENLMYVVSRYRKTTQYFHVLGVTSKLWMFIYALLDESGYVKNIGADSVSHRLSALIGVYDLANFKTLELGKNKPYKTTPMCNCPLCSSVDDLRIMHSWRLLEAHNLYVRARQTEFLAYLARSYLKGSVPLKEVFQHLDLPLTENKFATIVRYVQEVMAAKFRPLQNKTQTKGLFGGGKKVKGAPDAHYEKVISGYERFHGKKFPRG